MSETWSYEVRGSVAIWDLRGWDDPNVEDLEEAIETAEEVMGRPGVTAGVTLLDDQGFIDREKFDLFESYIDIFREKRLERAAFVSPDLKRLALVDVVNDVPDIEAMATKDPDEAIEWASA